MKSFQDLLEEQKKKQKKEQVAIAEAAQDYSIEIQHTEGLGQTFLKGGSSKTIAKGDPISNAAVSVITNFQADLDMIGDADYREFKQTVAKYKRLLGELPASHRKGRFSEREVDYISKIIGPVVAELHPLTGLFTKVRFGFKDFLNQFKPMKIAERLLGDFPILGAKIKDIVEAKEAGEGEIRRAEKAKGKDIARGARTRKEDALMGGVESDSSIDTLEGATRATREEAFKETPAHRIVSKEPRFKKGAQAEEQREELAGKQDDQFEENKNLFEMIAENTGKTADLLRGRGGIGEDDEGGGGGTGLGTASKVAGGALAYKYRKKLKTIAKGAIGKGSKFIKGAARVGGRLFLPVLAAISIFDAASSAAAADEILGKDKEDLTVRDRASAGVGGLLEGLSFGLLKKDKIAKWLAGSGDDKLVDSTVMPTKDEVKEVTDTAPVKDLVNIASKRTVVRTTLETTGLENMLEKMLPKSQTNNTVISPNNTIQTSNNTQILPNLLNKNTDDTILALKAVY